MKQLKRTTAAALISLLLTACSAAPQQQPAPPAAPAQPAPVPAAIGPATASLNALHFMDGTHGWVAGQGVIGATADGGSNWVRQYSGPAVLEGIGFTDVNHGWAWAPDTLLRTEDAGIHWTATPLPVTPLITAAFADPNHGWISTGDRQVGGEIQATADGGHTWQVQASPAKVQSVCAAGPDDAWAAGGARVMRTTDGGRTWAQVFTAPVADTAQWQAKIGCVSDTAAWVLFTDGAAMSHQAYVAFRTGDRGASWQPILAAPAAAAEYPSVKVTTGIDAYAGPFDVASGLSAFFLGSCGPCGNGGTASITRTTDAGRTWRHDDIPGVRNPVAISFIDAENGWILARGDGGMQVLSTIDGGKSWRVRQAPAF